VSQLVAPYGITDRTHFTSFFRPFVFLPVDVQPKQSVGNTSGSTLIFAGGFLAVAGALVAFGGVELKNNVPAPEEDLSAFQSASQYAASFSRTTAAPVAELSEAPSLN